MQTCCWHHRKAAGLLKSSDSPACLLIPGHTAVSLLDQGDTMTHRICIASGHVSLRQAMIIAEHAYVSDTADTGPLTLSASAISWP